jgi:hypothetical protein
MRARILVGLSFFLPSAFGQADAPPYPPAYRGVQTRIDGVFVTPVPGVPFSATVLVETTQTLQGVATDTRKSTANIARDSRGRIYNEFRTLMPASFPGLPPLVSAHIYDPQTRLNIFLNPARNLARQSTFVGTPAATTTPPWERIAANNPSVTKVDLGTKTVENLLVRGVQVTRTIPAAQSSGGSVISVIDEYWYSDDLHMNILTKHTDPRTGQQTVQIQAISRAEPDPLRFEVPAGYKIVDENPPR